MNPSIFPLAFVGGGNMASAIIGGLVRCGCTPDNIMVIEPSQAQRTRLAEKFGVRVRATPGTELATARTVVWAVKPQQFKDAAEAAGTLPSALHFSVMAGIRSADIANVVGTERVVRAMPNTPALLGQGMTGLYAGPAVNDTERETINTLMIPTGEVLWVDKEPDLDAVTALSGSGPAYVFYFIEAMVDAAQQMGLSQEQGKQLAVATFAGATALARNSGDSPRELRERVTSKGGTTFAALTHLEEQKVKQAFVDAMLKARNRAHELGDEFGR